MNKKSLSISYLVVIGVDTGIAIGFHGTTDMGADIVSYLATAVAGFIAGLLVAMWS